VFHLKLGVLHAAQTTTLAPKSPLATRPMRRREKKKRKKERKKRHSAIRCLKASDLHFPDNSDVVVLCSGEELVALVIPFGKCADISTITEDIQGGAQYHSRS